MDQVIKLRAVHRACLLGMVLLAAYQVAIGIEGLAMLPVAAYTVAFGVLLVAGLLVIILGFEALDSPGVVVLSTVVPLSLSVGLVWQHVPAYRIQFLALAVLGLAAVGWTRARPDTRSKVPVAVIATVHGVAGIVIFTLPILLSLQGRIAPGFIFVGLGGGLIGSLGLLLALERLGRPLLPRSVLLRGMPLLLFSTTALFVLGFRMGVAA